MFEFWNLITLNALENQKIAIYIFFEKEIDPKFP
jgi:hypothetical protein